MFITDADAYVIDLNDALNKIESADIVGIPISIEQDGKLLSELENHEYDIALNRIRPWMKRNFEKMFTVSGAGFLIRTNLVKENPIDADIMGEDLYYSCLAHVNGWTIEASESEIRTYAIPSVKALLIQRARWVRGYFQIIKRSGHHVPLVDSIPVIYRIIVTFLAIITLSMGRVDVTLAVLLAYFLYEYARSKSIKRSIQMMVYRQVNFLAFLYAPICGGWTVKR
jgi:cellulose synthase/poly-beta-1,6-N-acetylglucosamine synthase-like glycosyltransferase